METGQAVVVSEITLSEEILGRKLYCITNMYSVLAMKPKMKHLTSELNSIKYQWQTIGVQLEVESGSLKSIEYDERYTDIMRLSEVFQNWIDGRPSEVSWRKILDVIKNPPISNKRLLEDLQKFLSRQDIQSSYLSPNGPPGKRNR